MSHCASAGDAGADSCSRRRPLVRSSTRLLNATQQQHPGIFPCTSSSALLAPFTPSAPCWHNWAAFAMHTTTFDELRDLAACARLGVARNYLCVGRSTRTDWLDRKENGTRRDPSCPLSVGPAEIYKHNHAAKTKGQIQHLHNFRTLFRDSYWSIYWFGYISILTPREYRLP